MQHNLDDLIKEPYSGHLMPINNFHFSNRVLHDLNKEHSEFMVDWNLKLSL